MPLSPARLEPGDETVVVVVPASRIPLGAGVRDASVYAEVERMTGKELASYALAVSRAALAAIEGWNDSAVFDKDDHVVIA